MGKLITATSEADKLLLELTCNRLDAASARDFKAEFLEVWNEEIHQVEINFEIVEFIDSSGIGALLSVHKKLGENGSVVLTSVKPQVQTVIELLRLNRIFEIRG